MIRLINGTTTNSWSSVAPGTSSFPELLSSKASNICVRVHSSLCALYLVGLCVLQSVCFPWCHPIFWILCNRRAKYLHYSTNTSSVMRQVQSVFSALSAALWCFFWLPRVEKNSTLGKKLWMSLSLFLSHRITVEEGLDKKTKTNHHILLYKCWTTSTMEEKWILVATSLSFRASALP